VIKVCAWCGTEVEKAYCNRRGEIFCCVNHRTASNAALRRFMADEYKKLSGFKIDENLHTTDH